MKKLITLILFLFACGDEAGELFDSPDAGGELGQTAQAIYMPNSYGHMLLGGGSGQGAACPNDSWPTACYVPDSKGVVVQFLASTCSSWWQARFVEAWNYYDGLLAGWSNEWDLIPPEGGLVKYKMSCTTSGANKFSQDTGDVDIHDTSRGQLRQYRRGTININVNILEGSNETQKQRSARNSIKHEMGHMFGLGHPASCTGAGNQLMCGQSYTSADYNPSPAEQQMMKCYDEDSDTNPDC